MTIERTIQRKWTNDGIRDLRRLVAQAFGFDTDAMVGIHLFVPNNTRSEIYVIFIVNELEGLEGQRAQQWITKEQTESAGEGMMFEDLCEKAFKGEFSLFSNGVPVLESGLVILEAALYTGKMDKARSN